MATATIQRFGRYRLDALIGQGALAEVHTARHIRTGATVAVKVFHPHLVAQPGFAERFAAISRSLKTLSHRGIVPVTDAVLENGQAYLATEFLSSETLEDRLASAQLERRRFPLQDVIKWMELLCEAVDFAHAHEVVHGDLKPGNIMFNQAGEPVILDFALLRLVDRPATHNAHQIPGTPEYLAPEQARGKPADKLSDVYALGVILYELLTGQTPFQGNKVAVVMKHQSEPPPSPRQLGLQLPAGVEAVLMRALAKDAGERFPSPLALSRALRAAVERAAVAAKDEGTPVTASAPTYANSVSGWPEQAEVVTGKPAVVVDEPPRRPTNWRAIWAAVAAGVAGLAIIGGLAAWALAQEAAEVVGPKGLPRFSSGQFVQVIIDSDNAGASMLRGCPSIFWNGVLGVAYEGDVGRVLERRTCDGNWFYRVAFPDYATDEWDGTGWMDGRYLATR